MSQDQEEELLKDGDLMIYRDVVHLYLGEGTTLWTQFHPTGSSTGIATYDSGHQKIVDWRDFQILRDGSRIDKRE